MRVKVRTPEVLLNTKDFRSVRVRRNFDEVLDRQKDFNRNKILVMIFPPRPFNISDENALRIFERKVISKIYGPVWEDDVWKARSNSEINSLLQGKGIVRHAKSLKVQLAAPCGTNGE
jgi:hypothetical protein